MAEPPHFHVYTAAAEGPVKAFTCRASDTFKSRAAAHKWAAGQRSAGRRIVRQCEGGPECPNSQIPEDGARPPLPQRTARRRRRSPRLVRLRRRLDALAAGDLAELESWLESRAPAD